MSGRETKIPQLKFTVVQYMILLVFLSLAYGLWRLQVGRTDEYQLRAEQNRIKRVPMVAPRGKILDRDGTIIVDNYPSFSALLLRDQKRDLSADAEKIAAGLHLSTAELLDKIHKYDQNQTPNFQPIIIKEDIAPDDNDFIEAHRDEFPELETMMVYRRLYPKDGFMSHLIGYVGEVSEEMLNSPQFETYERGDIVGQSGVELYYNDILKGKDGSRRVLVNSKGKEVGRPKDANVPAIPGQKLRLTIDLDLQKAAELALEGKNGAIVAMDPRNGEILAMVSHPTFDPNHFATRISREEWNRLSTDPDHPLMNKAIQAQVAPGSVFKIIMSVAGLQEGIAETMKVNCAGGAVFYGRFFECWVKSGHKPPHGITNVSKAISQSCDVFFYTLAERLGIEKIAKWATALGLGQKTGIDLPNEVTGVMPSEEWKLKNFRQKWFAGETISVGIGQGALAVTPIQLARAIGGIAMGGTLHRPHVVNPSQLPPEYRELVASNTRDVVHVPIKPENWITITDGMAGVLAPGGTAAGSHLQGVDFGGKTGSTQVVSHAFREAHNGSVKEHKGNGWFAGVTPRRNPEIVVVVFFEGGEHGDLTAHIAAQVIKAYVDHQRQVRNNPTLFGDKNDPGSVPIAGVWTAPETSDERETAAEDEHLQGGTLLVKMDRSKTLSPKPARASHAQAISAATVN
jgi:penicillin-binding protein 2